MERLTSSNTFEMNMYQLALNQVYISQDGWTQYVEGPDRECSVCDLIRAASKTLGVELPILDDEDLSDLMTDWLQYGAEEPEGVVAVLYRALCAMASVRDKLFRYEDTGLEPGGIEGLLERGTSLEGGTAELMKDYLSIGSVDHLRELAQAEKDGRLVVLPCKVGDVVYEANKRGFISTYKVISIHISACSTLIGWELIDGIYSNMNGFEASSLGKTVFLTREEAEAALKKREEDNEAD